MFQPQVLRMIDGQHGAFVFAGPDEHAAETGAPTTANGAIGPRQD